MLKFYIGSVIFYFVAISVITPLAKKNFIENGYIDLCDSIGFYGELKPKLFFSVIPVLRLLLVSVLFTMIIFTKQDLLKGFGEPDNFTEDKKEGD